MSCLLRLLKKKIKSKKIKSVPHSIVVVVLLTRRRRIEGNRLTYYLFRTQGVLPTILDFHVNYNVRSNEYVNVCQTVDFFIGINVVTHNTLQNVIG